MRAVGIASGLLLLLIQSPHSLAQPARASAADIDLGTATLHPGEVAFGPLHGAIGLGKRTMVGTYIVPWSIALLDRFSVIPNGFVKVQAGRLGVVSLAVQTSLFYARLDDLDEDGLDARAIVWPSQVMIGADWNSRWSTTFELTGVVVQATADKLGDQDTEMYGVALANTFHVGVVQRFRWTRSISLWARGRLVLEHAPVLVHARAPLSESARIEIQARANSAELSSVGSGMVGVALHWRRMNIRLGVGYGHWIVPWVLLPVGTNLITGDVDLYWRF